MASDSLGVGWGGGMCVREWMIASRLPATSQLQLNTYWEEGAL